MPVAASTFRLLSCQCLHFIVSFHSLLSSEREEAKRRERAWASLNATAMKNPLYKLVMSGESNGSDAVAATPPVVESSGGSSSGANGVASQVQQQQQTQSQQQRNGAGGVVADNGMDANSPPIDNDEDVNASLRSLQKESEEEVGYSQY